MRTVGRKKQTFKINKFYVFLNFIHFEWMWMHDSNVIEEMFCTVTLYIPDFCVDKATMNCKTKNENGFNSGTRH